MDDCHIRERKFQRINVWVLLVLGLVSLGRMIASMGIPDYYAAFQSGLALAMFTFPALAGRFLKFKIPQDCRLLYYIFTFSTIVVGSAMYGYSWIPYWDKLWHFFSGILISAAGFIICHLLFYRLTGNKRACCILHILFPFLFNLSAAVLWEVYEYMLYILFGVDAVNNLTTGVNDTMQDMIVCLLGGILFSGSLLRAYLRGKYDFILRICIHFFHMRGQKPDLKI